MNGTNRRVRNPHATAIDAGHRLALRGRSSCTCLAPTCSGECFTTEGHSAAASARGETLHARPRALAIGLVMGCMVLLPSLGGCAPHNTVLKAQVNELRSEVKRLRSSSSAMRDRLDALEQRQTTPRRGRAASASSANDGGAPGEPSGRPNLAVVRLLPKTKTAPQAVLPQGPRPVLKGDRKGTSIVSTESSSQEKAGKRGGTSRARSKRMGSRR